MKLFCLFLLTTSLAFAQGKDSSNLLIDCKAEIKNYCAKETPGSPLIQCLVKNQENASDVCKQNIQRVTQALKQGQGMGAFGGVMGGGGGFFPTSTPIITYGGNIAPEKVSIEQHRYSVGFPLYRDATDSYSASVGGGSLRFGQPVILDSGTVVPQEFKKTEVSGQFARRLEDQKMITGKVSVGSASEKQFANAEDTTFAINGSYLFPGKDSSFWALTIFMSNNNPILNYLPIPGFVYFYRTEKFTGIFGIPFASVQWTPIDPWLISASIFGVSITTEVVYKHTDQIQSLIGAAWGQQTFIRSDRSEREDRILVDEKKVYLGFKSPIVEKLAGDLQIGQMFDRSVYEGRRFNDRRHGNAYLQNSWFAQWNFRYAF